MKPSFALDFRDGAIALLHRTSRGWQQVGATSINAPDLAEALSYMRSTALGLSPRGLATKLVLPNDQILMTTVHAPGPDAAKRRKQIKAALEGLTPYGVDDLAFDWSGEGSELRVAVVARETLAEAEAFAVEHRFNPVSFVAAPLDASFQGEPFFGPSALSETLLAQGERVERDRDAIVVVTRDLPREELAVAAPAPATASSPEPEQMAEPAPRIEPAPEVSAASDTAPLTVAEVAPTNQTAAPLPEAAPETLEVAKAAAAAEPTPPSVPPAPQPAMAMEPPAAEANSPAAPLAAKPDDLDLPDFGSAKVPPAGPAAFDLKALAVDLVDEAPMALDVASDGKSRTDGAESPAPINPPPAPDRADTVATGPVVAEGRDTSLADFSKAAAEARARKAPPVGPAPAQRPSVPRPTLAKRPAAPGTLRDALPFPGTGTAKQVAAGKARPAEQGATMLRLEPRNVVPLQKTAAPNQDSPAAKAKPTKEMGLFGKPAPVRGKPRYLGLILTGLLLLMLALVAAWSSFSLSQSQADPGAQPGDVGLAATDPASSDLPTIEEEALADGQDLPAGPTAVAADPAPETGLPSDNPAAAAVPGNAPQDEIFLAANDTAPLTRDPVLLPSLTAATDPPPQLGAPPPPFGTVYTFDTNGRIQPTPEGIITPEGVLLVEGAPAKVPPPRTATLPPPPDPATGPVLASAETTNSVLETFQADPALAGKKPRNRPEGLTPPPAPDQEGQTEAPATDIRFADIRPEPRPAALTQASAADALSGAAAASLAANGLEQSNEIALVTSRKPLARPDGADQAVDAAVAAALQSGEAEPQSAAETANLTPEEQAEPEVENPAPDIPTNASVAKQATDKDALNLSRLALIGIFGNASGRYAMIRQPNGGIKRVKVGDTIDGGKVAAITATELQYQKGGRMLTLTMPKG